MKAWYSKVRDTELKDGSVRATYVVTFETDNAELKREVEKYLQGIMDKDEPQTNVDQHVQHVESVKDETGRWVRVGQWEWEHHTDTTHFGKAKGESITTNKVEDEPQTDCPWE